MFTTLLETLHVSGIFTVFVDTSSASTFDWSPIQGILGGLVFPNWCYRSLLKIFRLLLTRDGKRDD